MSCRMRVLARAAPWRGRRLSPPLFAAVAFMFSDVFVTHVGNLNIVAVSAWLPWVFAALYLSFSRRALAWAAVAGVFLGVAALAGQAQMTLIVAGALGLYALWQAGWRLARTAGSVNARGPHAAGPLASVAVL